MEIHSPDNTFLIENIWAFCSKDEGGEGVLGAPMMGTTMPLIAADKTRLDQLRPLAKQVGEAAGKRVVLKRFKLVEVEEIIG
jgi:hypothetical protein